MLTGDKKRHYRDASFYCPSDLCITHVNHVTDVGCGLVCIFLHKCDVVEVRLSSTCNVLMWQAMN